MLKSLIYIANILDETGLYKRADEIDAYIKKAAEETEGKTFSLENKTININESDMDKTQILSESEMGEPAESLQFSTEAAFKEKVFEILKALDWESLGRDWPNDPVVTHRTRASEAFRSGDKKEAYRQVSYVIRYIDPHKDIRGWNKMPRIEKLNIISKINDINRIFSFIYPEDWSEEEDGY